MFVAGVNILMFFFILAVVGHLGFQFASDNLCNNPCNKRTSSSKLRKDVTLATLKVNDDDDKISRFASFTEANAGALPSSVSAEDINSEDGRYNNKV